MVKDIGYKLMDSQTAARVISDEELIARFATHRNHFSSNGVKWNAFLPPDDGELSTCVHTGLTEQELWKRGREVAEEGKCRLYGRADVSAEHVRRSKLDVKMAEPPPNHAHIIGWPMSEPMKDARLSLAKLIASEAKFTPALP